MSQLELDPVLVTPLRRPETRPRKRRRSRASQSNPLVWKVAVGIVVGAVVVTFAGRIAAFAMQPVLVTMRTGAEIRRLEEVKRREAQVNESLRQDILYLQTPAGIEQQARLRGYVKPGEVPIAFLKPEAPEAPARPEVKPVETAAARPATFSERVQSVLDTLLAVFGSNTRTR